MSPSRFLETISSTNMDFNATNETFVAGYKGPRLILGTLTISGSNNVKDMPTILSALSTLPIPITTLDTAPFHPTHRPGYVESLLGSALQTSRLNYEVCTKTMWLSKYGSAAGKGELHFQKVRESVQSSLERLKMSKVKMLLAARPDQEAAVAEIAGVFNAKVKEGLCEQWGVCEFDRRLLSDITKTADKRGWVPPKVYQGRYGVLHRSRAERLFDFPRAVDLDTSRNQPKSIFKETNVNVFDMPEVQETIQVLKAIEDMHGL
jgi:aryl-alcohol dehydrogenase-like predicted oxidoreductase